MTDQSVAEALRSDAPLVVIEAPAGCGKTHQAADYARWLGEHNPARRTLILTHTHAACDAIRTYAPTDSRRTQVCTFDGFITQLASAYRECLDLPKDVARWAIETPDGFEHLANRVGDLLDRSQAVRFAIVARYPVIICDEHQDTNPAQHRVALQLLDAAAKLRVFGDPRQAIYVRSNAERSAHRARWQALCDRATRYEALTFPHRWREGSPALGKWVLTARRTLEAGGQIDLRGNLPAGLHLILANNDGPRGQFHLDAEARQVRDIVRRSQSLLILAPTQDLVASIHAFFGRLVPIWEGHTREFLRVLAYACATHAGNAERVAAAMCDFIEAVVTGCTAERRDQILREIASNAAKPRRGIPAELQAIARCVLESPDHRGVARSLQRVVLGATPQGLLREFLVNHYRELREASRLDQFADPVEGQAELTRRRTSVRTVMPKRVISTIHKAKGLQTRDVVLMPCDASTFSGTDYKRCGAYVALSRATHSLTIVAGQARPSPLFLLP